MLDYHALRTINRHVQIYQKFPLPAIIFTPGFDVCWGNENAKQSYPTFCSPRGIEDLLAEYSQEQLSRTIAEEGSVVMSGAIPISRCSVTILPVLSGAEETVAYVLLILREGELPLTAAAYLPSKTAEALSTEVRHSIHGIFEAMDAAALKADLVQAGWLKPSLSSISGQSYHILRTVGNVSEYSKFQSGTAMLEEGMVDLADQLAELSEAVGDLCGSMAIPISFSITRKACLVSGDKARLESALMNLLHNSLYFTRPGNCIAVRLEVDGERIVLTVEDQGIGIPKAVLPQVWRPYFAYDHDRKGAGMGLGLALVKAIVSAHGGKHYITSKEGAGTRVTLEFPQASLTSPLQLRRDNSRSQMDDRFSILYTGLVDAAQSPYRQQ